MSYFEGYRCGNCEREVPEGSLAGECPSCSGPLLGRYDLAMLRGSVTREEFLSAGEGIWRFRELLPPFRREISLGEGNTPMIDARRLADKTGMKRLFIKDESANPTGSFKARGMAAAVSRAVDLGARRLWMPSAGNAGLALSAYAASCGIAARIYIPESTPQGVAEECRAYGAEVVVCPGTLPDAAARMRADMTGGDEVDLGTFREPCRVEGKKTIAFEIEDQLGGASPDWIIFPTGGGTGIVAIWKAYREMEELGWLRGKRPGMIAVQSTGCAPVVRAIESEAGEVEAWRNPETIASGIRVPGSRAGRQILEGLRDTGGTAVAVADKDIIGAAGMMAAFSGVFPSPEGAAALAGLISLLGSGRVDPSDSVVLVNTAGWSRYRFMLDPFNGGPSGSR